MIGDGYGVVVAAGAVGGAAGVRMLTRGGRCDRDDRKRILHTCDLLGAIERLAVYSMERSPGELIASQASSHSIEALNGTPDAHMIGWAIVDGMMRHADETCTNEGIMNGENEVDVRNAMTMTPNRASDKRDSVRLYLTTTTAGRPIRWRRTAAAG